MVKTQYFTFDGLTLESGEQFGPITLAFETYGKLNEEKSNAILILHALSGDSHAIGWWDNMIGTGKAFDINKYFIICSNVLGGCKGSTGPSSINPKTGAPYALDFPIITIGDMVNCQKKLIEFIGIDKLLSVAGGSMGGMQVLSWLIKFPEYVRSAIPIATTLSHSPQQIAFNEVGRQAIMSDSNWRRGNYYSGIPPAKGLTLARMVGHITYMSDISMAEKFGRQKKNNVQAAKFTPDFEVEGYLQYRGDSFVKRFDANSYLYLTKAIDNFDLSSTKELHKIIEGKDIQVLVISFGSDWLYPPYQSKEIVKEFKLAGIQTTYCEIDSKYGHDAFLIESKEEAQIISHFITKVFYNFEMEGEYEI